MERKKEKVCKHKKRESCDKASQSSKSPAQTPALHLVQDIRSENRNAVTTKAQVAMVLKAETIEDSECQSGSVCCLQYGNTKAKNTALTVRRTTRRAGRRRTRCAKPTANDCHAEGQPAISFEMMTPEPYSRKSQRHLTVCNERNSSPHQTVELSDVSSVYQRGKKMFFVPL